MLPMNNTRQGWNPPLIAFKYHLMELMSGRLIPTSWNMKTKLALGHLVTCELFLLDVCLNSTYILLADSLLSLHISFKSFRYRGTYCSQDVAIKVLKPERISTDMLREFAQEVYIMRFVCMIKCNCGACISNYWDICFSHAFLSHAVASSFLFIIFNSVLY